MSKDIRTFFKPINSSKKEEKISVSRKRSVTVITSDEDETEKRTPQKRSKIIGKRRKIQSDSDDESSSKKTVNKPKKTPTKVEQIVSTKDMFGKKPIKRIAAQTVEIKEKPSVKNENNEDVLKKEAEYHDDDDFENALGQLDTSAFETECINSSASDKLDLSKLSKKKNQKESPEKSDGSKKHKIPSPKKEQNKKPKLEIEKKSNKKDKSEKDKDPFKEIIQKKNQSAFLYQQYLHRGGARNPGSKEIPEGAEYCLAGLRFLITGVLDSLERDEADELITKYGGCIVHAVSKKLNYIVVGDDPGPSKLTKAESLGVKQINEDELLELIRKRPAGKASQVIITHSRKKEDKHTVINIPTSSVKISTPKKEKINEEEMNIEKSTTTRSSPRKLQSPQKNKPVEIKSEEIPNKKIQMKSPQKNKSVEIKSEEIPNKKIEMKSPQKNKSVEIKSEEIPNKKIEMKSPQKNKSVEIKSEGIPNKKIMMKSPVKIKSEVAESSVKSNGIKEVAEPTEALVEKYRPKTMKDIIGQFDEKSNANKLLHWLKNWYKNRTVKHAKPAPWGKSNDGSFFKAALLSGPPGIGKTTTAQVVCKELGFDFIEFNASDTRNKKLLHDEVAGILSNTTMKGYFTEGNKEKPTLKHVLIMDEVDGMAGNEDRGGLNELIALIKSTSIPIICICNDRNNPKMRTLGNYVFDLRFSKPNILQIKSLMKSVCHKECIQISEKTVEQLIKSTNQDIRQVINHLAMYKAGNAVDDENDQKQGTKDAKKDVRLGNWDVVRKVFSSEEHKHMSIHDKSDLFFHDYSIGPLFVQENYLSVIPNAPKEELLERIAEAAESIAIGDTIDNAIRKDGAWSLLPTQAMFSSVIPGTVLSGRIGAQINFPNWLGRNSRRNKFDRMLQEITVHTRMITGASKSAINLDYVKPLRDKIMRPLVKKESEGVNEAVDAMNNYHLIREDLDSLLELSLWPGQRDPMQSVNSKVKAAFTRTYNKHSLSYCYSSGGVSKKKGAAAVSQDEGFIDGEDNEDEDEDEDNDDITNDKMIKAKKTKAAPVASTSKASTSKDKPTKGKGRGRGRGK